MELKATPWDESVGFCDCCGRGSKTVWGDITADGQTVAVYYVQWTLASREHDPNFDFILGAWGDGADPSRRVLVSLLYRHGEQGGAFMVIDSEQRRANDPTLCGRALKRAEVIGTPLATEVFQLVDAVWTQDPRIADIREPGSES